MVGVTTVQSFVCDILFAFLDATESQYDRYHCNLYIQSTTFCKSLLHNYLVQYLSLLRMQSIKTKNHFAEIKYQQNAIYS